MLARRHYYLKYYRPTGMYLGTWVLGYIQYRGRGNKQPRGGTTNVVSVCLSVCSL